MKKHVSMLLGVLCAVGLALFGLTATAAAAPSGDNLCSVTMQNPHSSTGSQGVIAKSNWTCDVLPTEINLQNDSGFVLYLCGYNPPKDKDTIFNTCAIKGDNVQNINLTQSASIGTRYAPAPPNQGAHGSGWWISVATWQSFGPGGTGNLQVSYSNAVQFSG